MADKISWSMSSDPTNWDVQDIRNRNVLQTIYRRPGVEFVAGPFATEEESRAALALLVAIPKGNA